VSSENEKVPPVFVAALAGGMSVKAAGEAAGMSERTAYRRWARPEVRREVAALRAVVLQEAVGRLTLGTTRAAEVVLGLLDSEDEKVRLAAACRLPELRKSLVEAAGDALADARPPSRHDEQMATLVGGPFDGFQLEHGAA
jgi:hypothetical protein